MREYLDKVQIDGMLIRHYEGSRNVWGHRKFKETKDAVIIGVRTLSNGKAEWEGGQEEGTVYTADEWIQAYLVVFAMNRNPVYVTEDLIK